MTRLGLRPPNASLIAVLTASLKIPVAAVLNVFVRPQGVLDRSKTGIINMCAAPAFKMR